MREPSLTGSQGDAGHCPLSHHAHHRQRPQTAKMLLNNSQVSRPFLTAHGHCDPQAQCRQTRGAGESLTAKLHPPRLSAVYRCPTVTRGRRQRERAVTHTPDPSKSPRIQPHLPCGIGNEHGMEF